MNKFKLACTVGLFATMQTAFAGGILTNTNQNIHFNRMFARNAAIGIDGVYSNPAGVAFMSNGLHLSFNNQSVFQTRTIWSGIKVHGMEGTPFYTPFSMNGGDANGIKEYEGTASAPILPSIQAAYNMDKWGLQASFAVSGGGGKCTFNEGLGSFERTVSLIPMALHQLGLTSETPGYSVSSYIYGRQFMYGLQLGATYKINPDLAVYGGFRFCLIKNKYEGNITNITANINGSDEKLHDYLGVKANEAAQAAAIYTQLAMQETDADRKAAYEQMAAQYTQAEQKLSGASAMVADKYLECTQTGWCITPIIGIDYRMGKLNLAARYEFTTKFNIQNNTKRDDTGLFADGVNTPSDLPGILSLGAQYEFTPKLRAGVGYHHFFDKDARMANNKQRFLSHNTQEFLAGVEYDITDAIQVSIGGQKTNYGLGNGGFLNDMSFVTSSYSIGLGAGIKVAKNMKLNIAYFWTNYEHFNKTEEKIITLAGNSINGTNTDEFTRTNKVFGVGLDIDF